MCKILLIKIKYSSAAIISFVILYSRGKESQKTRQLISQFYPDSNGIKSSIHYEKNVNKYQKNYR